MKRWPQTRIVWRLCSRKCGRYGWRILFDDLRRTQCVRCKTMYGYRVMPQDAEVRGTGRVDYFSTGKEFQS